MPDPLTATYWTALAAGSLTKDVAESVRARFGHIRLLDFQARADGGTQVRLLVREATPQNKALAWRMYVQLVTRVALAPMSDGAGLDREALSSLHAVFRDTRAALVEAGVGAAKAGRSRGDRGATVGELALRVLGELLRPFLSTWHPRLLDHEETRPKGTPRFEHEQQWADHVGFRAALRDLQGALRRVAIALEGALGMQPMESLLGPPADAEAG